MRCVFTAERLALSLLLVLGVSACDGSSASSSPNDVTDCDSLEADSADAGAYPLDDVLRLNHIQLKGTHNSYHLAPAELAVPDWDYSHAPLKVQLSKLGVRQVELDIHWHAEDETFHIYHIPILDDRSTCATLKECLSEMLEWSVAHPDHAPLFILIEPKDDVDLEPIVGHYDDLDREILEVWPRERVLTPDDARGDHPDLRKARIEDGWPTLGECRGKAIFQMLDSDEHRANYLGDPPSLAGRVLFVRGGEEDPWGGFVEKGAYADSEEDLKALALAGMILRSSPDNILPEKAPDNPIRAAIAIRAGVHLISTDMPAPVEDGYWFELPDGVAARCNPITAPPECTPEDVENLSGGVDHWPNPLEAME